MTHDQKKRLDYLIDRKAYYDRFGKRFWQSFAIAVSIGGVIAIALLCACVKAVEAFIIWIDK